MGSDGGDSGSSAGKSWNTNKSKSTGRVVKAGAAKTKSSSSASSRGSSVWGSFSSLGDEAFSSHNAANRKKSK